MKRHLFAILMAGLAMALPNNTSAQEDNGFKRMNVNTEFAENGFQWFNKAELLAAGNKEKSNAMTIGWGGISTLWGRTALTVYVAEKRYTKQFMDKAEYNKLLAEALENLPANPNAGKVRVFVGGGPKDNTQLYELIESCGATVVGEDHCWGNRYSEDPVDESDPDPLHAIFRRYIFLKGCPYVYPLQSRVDNTAKFASRAKADAAVFSTFAGDTMGWDIPEEIKAVEALGAKTLYLKKQPYKITDPEAVKEAVSKLIADCQ